MTTYFCSKCRKECQPELTYVGPSAVCHEESALMVMDDEGSYYGEPPALRLLDRCEEETLTEALMDDQDTTPAMRARDRVMGGS